FLCAPALAKGGHLSGSVSLFIAPTATAAGCCSIPLSAADLSARYGPVARLREPSSEQDLSRQEPESCSWNLLLGDGSCAMSVPGVSQMANGREAAPFLDAEDVVELPLLLLAWQLRALETTAHAHGRTAAELIRQLLTEFLTRPSLR